MKRKKWSEAEEQTLLSKYMELLNSGALSKLKTREKKFKPIAEYVNSVHHLEDPLSFPFKWSWRDLSIKVQNMRHQYLGVKQKIKISNNHFNWEDGQNHWENFLMYKQVFGDVELSEAKPNFQNVNFKGSYSGDGMFDDEGFMVGSEEIEDEDEEEEGEMFGDDVGVSEEGRGEKEGCGDRDIDARKGKGKRSRECSGGKRLRMVGEQVLELRRMMVKREEKRRESEWRREEREIDNDNRRKEREFRKEMFDMKRDEDLETWDIEFGDRQIAWARKEYERRVRMEKEFDEERRRRMKLEEKWEEEERQWREMMVGMQIEHEKQMMQLHMDSCQNQMQVLSFVACMWCQFFGSMNDGMAGGLGPLPPQVMQNLHHAGNLGANGKPDTDSPSEFL